MVLAGSLVAAGQSAPPAQSDNSSKTAPAPSAAPASPKPAAVSKTVKAESVTINMPEGMTRDQADAILNELKSIHQLLLNPPAARAAAAAPASVAPNERVNNERANNEKVKMSVGAGWYSMGRDDAPVTMVEFADYQCPFCRRFETGSFAQLKKEYIDTGKVRFVSRDLPVEFHPNAPGAAMAARCAGEQNKFWEMRDAMMLDTATDLGPESILKYGQKTNLDMTAFSACLKEKKFTEAIKKDTTDAGSLGISGTPSFVIGKTAKDEIVGVRVVGAVPFAVFDSAIKEMLTAK